MILEAAARKLAAERALPWAVTARTERYDGRLRVSGLAASPALQGKSGWQELYQARPADHLLLRATGPAPKSSGVIELFASHCPQSGWCVGLAYAMLGPGISNTHRETVHLDFYGPDFSPAVGRGHPQPALQLPIRDFETTIRRGLVSYQLRVPVRIGTVAAQIDESTAEVPAWLNSPESLRDLALAQLDALEARARETIPTGAAVVELKDSTGRSGGDPPMPEPLPPLGKYELQASETQPILNDLLQDIAARRQLISVHYRDLHAAAVQAFPLAACLQSPEDR